MAVTIEQKAEFDALADQVRANGFTSLKTKVDRDRYRELKAMIDADNTPMTLTKADIEKMIADAVKNAGKLKTDFNNDREELKKLSEWKPYTAPTIGNRIARLKIFRKDGVSEAGLVIDWRYKSMAFNEVSRKHDVPVYQITVLYDNGQKKNYDMELTKLAQITETETVEIIKQNIEEQVMVTGRGNRAVTKNGYNFSNPQYYGTKKQGQGEPFDFEVHRQEVDVVVKRPNGKTLALKADRFT